MPLLVLVMSASLLLLLLLLDLVIHVGSLGVVVAPATCYTMGALLLLLPLLLPNDISAKVFAVCANFARSSSSRISFAVRFFPPPSPPVTPASAITEATARFLSLKLHAF